MLFLNIINRVHFQTFLQCALQTRKKFLKILKAGRVTLYMFIKE